MLKAQSNKPSIDAFIVRTGTSIWAAFVTGTSFHCLFKIQITLNETLVIMHTIECTLAKGQFIIIAAKYKIFVTFWFDTGAQWVCTLLTAIRTLIETRT